MRQEHQVGKHARWAVTHLLAFAVLVDVIAPAQLKGLAHQRVKRRRRISAHTLRLPHAVDLAGSLEAAARALRRRSQLVI